MKLKLGTKHVLRQHCTIGVWWAETLKFPIGIWMFVQFFVSEAKFEWINQRDFRVSEAQKSIEEFARKKENHANKM